MSEWTYLFSFGGAGCPKWRSFGRLRHVNGRQVLGDRYRLDERLGYGGMSVVWRGHDTVLGRSVAVKILASAWAAKPDFRKSLRAEAQAVASLSHPNVTSVFDYGESEDDAGGYVPYVVMELLRGELLSARLAKGPLDPPLAMRVCAQVAGALAAAHEQGVVHRDIKPGNVMLTPAGAKVFDFGIAAQVGQLSDADPKGPILGTAAYLAPERLAGAPVTSASDVYALAILLYRTLTSRLPWSAQTVTGMIAAHAYVEPGPLPELDGLPSEVRDLALRCLSKDPRDRPSARQAAIVLAAAAGIRPPLGEEGPENLAAFLSPTGRGRRYVTLGGTGAVAAAVAAVAAVALSGGDRSTPAQAGTSPNSILTVTVGGGAGTASHSSTRRPLGPSANIANTWPNLVLPVDSATPDTGTSAGATQPASTPTPTSVPTPTPTPTPPAQQTLTSTGGSMDVTCTGSEVYLVSWKANSDFKVQGVERGPGSYVWVVFRRKQVDYTMTVVCKDGVAVGKESRHDVGGGGGGGGSS